MTLAQRLIERYELETQAPTVDHLIVLWARVERIENYLKTNTLTDEGEIDSPTKDPPWEAIREYAETVEARLTAGEAMLTDHETRLDNGRIAFLALRDRVDALETAVANLDTRVTALENQ